ncbi:hypothetical protein D3C79_789100 [compost metagenome]
MLLRAVPELGISDQAHQRQATGQRDDGVAMLEQRGVNRVDELLQPDNELQSQGKGVAAIEGRCRGEGLIGFGFHQGIGCMIQSQHPR